MFEVGVEFFLETANLSGPVEGGVESEKAKNDLGVQIRQPLTWTGELSLWFGLCLKIFVDQILGSGERILFFLFATWMRSKARGISFVAKISDGEVVGRMPEKDFRFEMTVMNHPRSHPGSDQDNVVPFLESDL